MTLGCLLPPVQVGGGVIEVLSTGGDASLGGDDWDAAIVQWLVETHLKPARIDCTVRPVAVVCVLDCRWHRHLIYGNGPTHPTVHPPTHLYLSLAPLQDPRVVANLRGVAEAAKIKLSSEERVVIRMPLGGGIEAVLTRQVRGWWAGAVWRWRWRW